MFAIVHGVHAPNEMLQIRFIENAPVAVKVALVKVRWILVYSVILLQSGLFQERLKSHGAIVRAMKEGGFVSFGQFVGVVDFVACVGRGDIKFTH